MSKQIDAMKKMGLSDAEIKDLIECDKAIDKGEKMPFDLTPEQTKTAKEFTKTGSKTVYNFGKKTKKKNEIKADLITKLADFLQNHADNVEITNAERFILMKIGENKYEIELRQKRK